MIEVTPLTDHLDLWTSALLTKSTAGRGSNGKQEAYGIKKLRELILELAVRGKLVPQDPNDEPASALLEKIEKEKKKLIKEGKIKKQETLPEISDDEKPFKLPQGWEWIRLGDALLQLTDGSHNSPASSLKGYAYITITDINNDIIDFSNCKLISEADYKRLKHNGCEPQMGDVLFSKDGTVGKVTVIDFEKEFVVLSSLSILRPATGTLYPYFLKHLLKSVAVLGQAIDYKSGSALKRIVLAKINLLKIVLPPLAEQHRIVAKVNELMALCDQLEQEQTNSIEAHQTLVETLLGALTRLTSPQELAKAWNRIAENFDTLFTTEHSIDQLKLTILQLAVMGKLVPQDPNDEPASVLLKRIAEKKRQLVREGMIKTQPVFPSVKETPYELPELWMWSRLGSVGLSSTGKTPSTRNSEYYGGEIQFIGPGQITPTGKVMDSEKSLSESGCEESVIAESGDILMVCIGGSIGKSAIASSRVAFNQQINSIRPIFVSSELLNYAMNTPQFQTAVLKKATGSATPIINRSKWEELIVPIPPLTEQHRIVAKVDELMTLCDALKTRLADAQATQIRLADAIVEQAVA